MQIRPLADEAATLAWGMEVGAAAQPGSVFALIGELGAGKTRFAKGLAAGVGYTGEVTSPTFALVQEYRGGRLPVFHFDFYRVEAADELLSLGWDDYLDARGVCVIEWADKFADLLPADTRWFHFSFGDDGTRSVSG